MKKPESKFQTHIAEPRWQRIVSVVIVVGFVLLELLFVLYIL